MDLSLKQLATYRDQKRVLLVFTPSAEDKRYLEQKGWLESRKTELEERDLAVFYLPPGGAVAIKEQFSVTQDRFMVVLVGKDGGEKERYDEPVQPNVLFETIDQMPMRRREIAEHKKS